MRHLKKRHRLGRGHAHRAATLKALSVALIRHKRITTTISKAKALREYVEPILNRAKEDNTHNRREAFRHLQDKESIKVLFSEIAEALGDRNGGYTRIVKLGARPGDAAEKAVIELVDFNTSEEGGARGAKKRRTRRSAVRRGSEKPATKAPAAPKAPDEKLTEPAEGKVDVIEDDTTSRIVEPEGTVEAAPEPLTDPAEGKVDLPEADAEPSDEEETPKS